MIKEGLPCYRFGNRITVKRDDFDNWVEENHRVVEGNTNRDLKSLLNEVLTHNTN